jgi:hypothetical protein
MLGFRIQFPAANPPAGRPTPKRVGISKNYKYFQRKPGKQAGSKRVAVHN